MHYELAGPAAVGVNQEVAAAYVQALSNRCKKNSAFKRSQTSPRILRLPGVIGAAAKSMEGDLPGLEAAVAQCLTEALDKLDRMREQEAAHLCIEMSQRLQTIASLAAQSGTNRRSARAPRSRSAWKRA